MPTAQLISEQEYLHTSFEHDAEYVEGRIVYRPMPQKPHSSMQVQLSRSLCDVAEPLGYEIFTEQRVRTVTNPPRYRIPDICATFGEPDEDIFTHPPFLCIEILSPDESVPELRQKVEEYLALGVLYVWTVDPVSLAGEIVMPAGITPVRDGVYRAGDLGIDFKNIRRARARV